MNMRRGKRASGSILIMTLVFVTMFGVMFIGLSGLTGRQFHQGALQSQDERAFQIAESGLNYARWRLAHNTEDFSQEVRTFNDPLEGEAGSFDVQFEAPTPGSTIVEITSVGATKEQPTRDVTLKARYGIPSLAKYASITNSDVWYGGQISGDVHANGGIRMDGTSDSIVSSARQTYICQPSHGCSSEEKPGVWGTGEKSELWEFPVPVVDYNAITLDLLSMQSVAQNANTYWGPSGAHGYHAMFNSNNTVSIFMVSQKASPVWSWTAETGWEYSSYDIGAQTLLETIQVPSGGILYFEDTLWISGTVQNRITVAAGRFPDSPSTNADIIIHGNVTYEGVHDGSRVFGAIAQRHVLIPYSGAPDNLQLDGAYIAQKGRFGRRYYGAGAHTIKTSMNRYGMIASNMVPVTAWVNGSGQVISGYQQGESSYDSYLLYGPPPYFPTSGQYEFLSWEQVE